MIASLLGLLLMSPLQREMAEPGQLSAIGKDGKPGVLCPLEKTKVFADIGGFGARVTVIQTFTNPSTEPIEAVYTFPLPHDAAVDRMNMLIGERVIEGEIKRREEARRVYEAAKAAGQAASLLDQERPNIFTQSVANIMPGARIQVEISYVQVLKYEEGEFEFTFPMVVGPRFLGNAQDPDKISPPIVQKGMRTGTNVELTVFLDAGAPIEKLESVLHQVKVQGSGNARTITLAKRDEIPNRDFILRYACEAGSVQSAFLTTMDPGKGGFFTLVLLPPKAPTEQQIAPKEIIFVMDQSGSQSGFPIEKSKELTLKLIRLLRPEDTFNVIGFNNVVTKLWPESRANLPRHVTEAEDFIKAMQANGGTQLRDGVMAALEEQKDSQRLRIVLFNTDGFVGDEAAILESIQKNRGSARMFTFGIGNSVNRYLIDAMSVEGRGDVEYVTLAESADKAVDRFARRLNTPVLTDIDVSFEGGNVEEAFPAHLPDVFTEKPVVIYGRYSQAGPGKVYVKALLGGKPWNYTYDVNFSAAEKHKALPTLWARRKVDDLTRQNYRGFNRNEGPEVIANQITDVALEFGIMSQYTSFVAVEKRVVNVGGRQRTVRVPVEMADGVSYEGVGLGEARLGFAPSGSRGRSASGFSAGGVLNGVSGGGAAGKASGGTSSTTGTTGGGFGGGGFGGGGFGLIAHDASDNSIILKKESLEELKKSMKPEEFRKFLYERKVERDLRSKKGKLEIQVLLSEVTDAVLQKLKKAGMTVDTSDKTVKVAFGTADASKLIELSQIDEVQRIEPVEN